MTSLAANPRGLSFSDLGQFCGLTDGNLNRHLKVLADEELIEVVRRGRGRSGLTHCRLTSSGRDRFLKYLEELQRVVADAAVGAAGHAREPTPRWAT
jgi:predicted ArsR family transcriptional regulator